MSENKEYYFGMILLKIRKCISAHTGNDAQEESSIFLLLNKISITFLSQKLDIHRCSKHNRCKNHEYITKL